MGVQGLWQLLQPAARPVTLESLQGKKLAIDSSIWLYHFQMAMRDKEGRTLANAHILGFLWRILKLLFYGIQPVFVFDGGAPVEKRRTLANRKQRKTDAVETHARAAEKLLAAQLRQAALAHLHGPASTSRDDQLAEGTVYYDTQGRTNLPQITGRLNDTSTTTAPAPATENSHASSATSTATSSAGKRKDWHKDPYQLPALEEPLNSVQGKKRDLRLATEGELRALMHTLAPDDLDTNSELFRSLPPELQYELVGDLRAQSRSTSYHRLQDMLAAAPTPIDFSRAQIAGLRTRNDLTQKVLTVTDEIGSANIQVPVRVAGARNREYVLVHIDEGDGGWALGTRDAGSTQQRAIDVDAHDTKHAPVAHIEDDNDDIDAMAMEEVEIPDLPTAVDPEIDALVHLESDPVARKERALKLLGARAEHHRRQKRTESGLDAREERMYGHAKQHAPSTLFRDEVLTDDRTHPQQILRDSSATDIPAESSAAYPPSNVANNSTSPPSHLSEALLRKRSFARVNSSDGSSDHEFVPERRTDESSPNATSSTSSVRQLESGRTDDLDEDAMEDVEIPDANQPTEMPTIDTIESGANLNDAINSPRKSTLPPNNRHQNTIANETLSTSLDTGAGIEHGLSAPNLTGLSATTDETCAKSPIRIKTELIDDKVGIPGNDGQKVAHKEQQQPDKMKSPSASPDRHANRIIIDTPSSPLPMVVSETKAEKDSIGLEEVKDANSKAPNWTSEVDLISDTDLRRSFTSPSPSPSETKLQLQRPSQSQTGLQRQSRQPSPSQAHVQPKSQAEQQAPPELQPKQQSEQQPEQQPKSQAEQQAEQQPKFQTERQAEQQTQPPPSTSTPATNIPSHEKLQRNRKTDNRSVPSSSSSKHLPTSNQNATNRNSMSPTPFEWSPSVSPEPANLGSDGFPLPHADELVEIEQQEQQALEQMDGDLSEYTTFLNRNPDHGVQNMQKEVEAEVEALRKERARLRRNEEDVTLQMAAEVQALLRLFGLPYITAPMEAEAQCAQLAIQKLVDGIITDDSDVFLFGGTPVYRNMFNDRRMVECYLLSDIERELSLSRDRLISLAFLLGSDYTEGLDGVGPVLAMEILSLYPGPDGLRQFRQWWQQVQIGAEHDANDPNATVRRRIKKSLRNRVHLSEDWPDFRTREAYVAPSVDSSDEPFVWGRADLDALRAFLNQYLHWPVTKSDQYLLPVIEQQRKNDRMHRVQATLDQSGFVSGRLVGERGHRPAPTYGSARLQQVVNSFKAQHSTASSASASNSSTSTTRGKKRRAPRAISSTPAPPDSESDHTEYTPRPTRSRARQPRASDAGRAGSLFE
ncbi:DNA repair protein rad2 [Malassezia yamatoensis]|uniref:DNA repair protein rad2 n=1 Tax=Malassezia yamatoensis TaxID=253288 RepID=A0AAJ5YTI0_9BASI|nr:DNA repair protein rad2 [Malassezia yamatoensis]